MSVYMTPFNLCEHEEDETEIKGIVFRLLNRLPSLLGASLLAQLVKNLPASAGDRSSVSGLGWSPGEGNGHPPQYSCLENPMDRGAWRATVHGVRKSWT